MPATPFEIRNGAGERLDFTLTRGTATQPSIVVIGHGVTANKDRPWALTLAAKLETAGISTLRFSFAGNGDSEGRFGDATISKEVEDLGAVLDACDRKGLSGSICYVGHSMGAAVGVLRASTDSRISSLVSLGGMVDTADFAQRKFGELTPGEDFMWDKPECSLSAAYMEDLATIGSVASRGGEIRAPWLLVHGTEDSVVPIEDSLKIAQQAATPPRVVQLSGADHVFSGEAAERMAELVYGWLKETQ